MTWFTRILCIKKRSCRGEMASHSTPEVAQGFKNMFMTPLPVANNMQCEELFQIIQNGGLLPGAMGQLGLYLLFSLRLVQGLCTGGEIGAVATYITEVAAQRSMGRCVAFISMTANLGFMSARAVIWFFQDKYGEEEMLNWGWRWPFIVALIPGVISVFGRLFCLKESELFQKEHEHTVFETDDEDVRQIEERPPDRKSTRRQLKEFACDHFYEVLIGIGGVIYFAVFQYGGLVWVNSFLKKHGAPVDALMMAGTFWRLGKNGGNYGGYWVT